MRNGKESREDLKMLMELFTAFCRKLAFCCLLKFFGQFSLFCDHLEFYFIFLFF